MCYCDNDTVITVSVELRKKATSIIKFLSNKLFINEILKIKIEKAFSSVLF